MAGEYYRWLARDVKPEEKRELTREEKIKNWIYYYKYHVVIGLVLVGIAVSLICNALGIGQVQPDYAIAYVGSRTLPEETVTALQQRFAALGRDENGDGVITVEVNQYVSYSTGDSDSLYYAQIAETKVIGDIADCDSYFFLMEDPARFQEQMHVLCRLDGSLPEDSDFSADGTYVMLDECPALAEIPLDGRNPLAIGRRGFWNENTVAHPEGCEMLWNALMEGLIP